MNVFDLLIPAITQSLSNPNWLLGLMYAIVVTSLIGLLVGWLWGRLWNATWSPWTTTLPIGVVSFFMVTIFASLLTLHGLTGYNYGFFSEHDVPTEANLTAWKRHLPDPLSTSSGEPTLPWEKDGINKVAAFCYDIALQKKPNVMFSRVKGGDNSKRQEEEAKKRQDERYQIFGQLVRQYKQAYQTALVVFVSSMVLMLIAIATLAYIDIKLIPLAPEFTKK